MIIILKIEVMATVMVTMIKRGETCDNCHKSNTAGVVGDSLGTHSDTSPSCDVTSSRDFHFELQRLQHYMLCGRNVM